MPSPRAASLLLAVIAVSAAALTGCPGRASEVFVTYFDGDHGLSLRYPAAWRTDTTERDGVRYRYFLAPPGGPQNQAPVAVTLLVTRADGTLDDYAQAYLAGQKVSLSRPEERQGVRGKSWTFAASDGTTRSRLLLLGADGRVAGLHAQGDAVAMEKGAATLDEIFSSFTVERPDLYPVHDWRRFETSLGVPRSWRQTREFGGGGTLLVQFASPPLLVERRETVHAALSVTLERAPAGGLREYYEATRRKLGENYPVASHQSFRGGFVDVMRTETPLAVSFIKRYYFVHGGRACSLSFEAREDVFPRAARWADYIASTLRLGGAAGSATPNLGLPEGPAAAAAAEATPATASPGKARDGAPGAKRP